MRRYQLYQYSLPLNKSLNLTGNPLKKREGILLAIPLTGVETAWGEIAPFPGLHQETLPEAVAQVKGYMNALPKFPDSIAELAQQINNYGNWLPSVRFGVEQALLHRISILTGQSFSELIGGAAEAILPVNGLLVPEILDKPEKVREFVMGKFSAVKVKVARQALENEARVVSSIAAKLPESIELRLDANRGWTFDQAIAFSKKIPRDRIAYIEEPISEPKRLPEFYEQSGLPLALDETLDDIPANPIHFFDGLKALIIKPSVVGGFLRSLQLLKQAGDHQIDAVFSCAFLSGVGLRGVAALASIPQHRQVTFGLSTLSFFAADILQPRVHIEGGCLDLKSIWRSKVNDTFLTTKIRPSESPIL